MAIVIPDGARIIDVDLNTLETNVFQNKPYETHEQFYSTDIGMAYLRFTGLEQDYTGCTARLGLINFNDGTKVQRTLEMDTETTFVYPMLETELAHGGRWIGQLTVVKDGTTVTDNPFRFRIDGPILTVPLISFDNVNTFTDQLTTIYDGLNAFLDVVSLTEADRVTEEGLRVVAEGLRVTAEELRETAEDTRQTTFEANEIIRDGIVNSLVTAETIAQKVAEKYQLIEAESANRLLSVEQQLAQKAKKHWADVTDFGADRTGVLSFRQALVDALAFAVANGLKCLYIPAGDYYFPATSNGAINIPSNFTIRGDGFGTIIHFDDNPVAALTWGAIPFRAISQSNIIFRDFKMVGSLDKYPTSMQTNALPLIEANGCEGILFDNVHLEGCRTVTTQIADCKNVTIINSSVKNAIRDGFRCVNCSNVKVTNNLFYNVADDSISVSSVDSVSGHVNLNTIITNNIFILSQGVKALGGKNVVISDNIFKLCHNTAISVCYIASGGEGKSIPMSLSINNNIIEDNIRFAQFGEGALIIDIIGTIKSADANGKIPGFTIAPYTYNWQKSPTITPPFDNVSVTNNKIVRTRPITTKISDYGYGTIIIRDSTTPYNDLEIVEACFATYAVQFKNCINDIIFAGNVISGYNTLSPLVFISAYTGISFENVLIKNNIFRDNLSSQISLVNPVKKVNFVIDGNTFDVDPYFRNPAHNADNSWNSAVTGGVSNGIAGDVADVLVINNIFKNCYQVFGSPKIASGNYAYMQTGTPNKGISVKQSCTAIEINGDPTNANYMQVI